ncbi:exodeoxyribonuclease III [Rhodopila sp.]|jgi:exodeoxyribonuclease-3|uniref:exodeoxyribonuclease III n=1 Tax=Rhodopila sp. TaxID=2480087 RepID=UPI002D17FC40|nr:exodeoxyribonuclease III [Rhodopila sp.]HVZ10587.1 exodeoxyribonuclease III [Rhodopila sp.]
MKIATWNVNSIRQREAHVHRWLQSCQPDVLFLQEIKCETAAFPVKTFEPLGYRSQAVGQKSYNGVAVIARVPFTVTHTELPGLPADDAQARYIEIQAAGMTLIGIYLPNGNSRGEEGFAYKLAWMDCLAARAKTLLAQDIPLLITGDFNVCPTEEDLAPGALSSNDALIRPESRQRFRTLLWLGLTDAVRAIHPHGTVYTFWDYQAGAWQRDLGLRIDHTLLSPTLAEKLIAADPDREERAQPQPSDHVPVTVTLDD